MSLFENEEYRWRETYFVLFDQQNRPTPEQLVAAMQEVNENYQLADLRKNEAGEFESLTILSPDDYAGMDITFLSGPEVQDHTLELVEEMLPLVTGEEKERLRKLPEFDARLDVFHFEQLTFTGPVDADDMDDFIDPGSLLLVLEKLAELTGGIGVDQDTGTLI
jgi:hypothetical protein